MVSVKKSNTPKKVFKSKVKSSQAKSKIGKKAQSGKLQKVKCTSSSLKTRQKSNWLLKRLSNWDQSEDNLCYVSLFYLLAAATDQVVPEGVLVLHVLEAVLADPKFGLLAVIFWEGREVPRVDLKVADLDLVHVFHLGDLQRAGGPKMRVRKTKIAAAMTDTLPTASCSFSSAAVVGSISAYVCKKKRWP